MGNKPKKTSLTKQCLDWLHQQGCFADRIYMTGGAVVILAIKNGKVLIVCSKVIPSHHDPKGVIKEMVKAGASAVCIKDLKMLVDYVESGIFWK